MRILVIGSGGREHALAWKLSQSPSVRVYAAPGNPGMARCADCIPAGDGTPKTLLAVAELVNADLTVVGPEAPLVTGAVDAFRAAGRAIVGIEVQLEAHLDSPGDRGTRKDDHPPVVGSDQNALQVGQRYQIGHLRRPVAIAGYHRNRGEIGGRLGRRRL